MNLQEVILSVLSEKDNLQLCELVRAVSLRKPALSVEQISITIQRMRGQAIARRWRETTNDFHYTILKVEKDKPTAKVSIKSSVKEVIARQVLNGANIEAAAEQFACRPLTVIRKVQEFCMKQDPDLYVSLVRGERKTATIEDLREAFSGY